MKSRVQGADPHYVVETVGKANIHGIDRRASEQLFPLVVDLGIRTLALSRVRGDGLDVVVNLVAASGDLEVIQTGILELGQAGDVARSSDASAANDTQPNLVAHGR